VRRFGALQIDPGAREVMVGDEMIELSRTEFDLLAALAAHRRLCRRVVPKTASHYSLLATLEDRFGVPRLRRARFARPPSAAFHLSR
jgi:DNA-binding response OmpR family regulator